MASTSAALASPEHDEALRLAHVAAREPFKAKRSLGLFAMFGLLLAAVPIIVGLDAVSLFSLTMGLVCVAWGAFSFVAHRGARLMALASDQLSIGRPGVAAEVANLAKERSPLGIARKQAALLRARVALASGDLAACRREAELARATKAMTNRGAGRALDLMALSFAAFSAAAMGDESLAHHEIVTVRALARRLELGSEVLAGEQTLAEPLARVALAEALIFARSGKHEALRKHLVSHRALILLGLPPRDRALFRGLQRLARARVVSPYRHAQVADVPSSRGELAPEDWVERVLPELGSFVVRPKRTAAASTYDPSIPNSGVPRGTSGVPLPRASNRDLTAMQAVALPIAVASTGILVGLIASGRQAAHQPPLARMMIGALAVGIVGWALSARTRLAGERRILEHAYRASAEGNGARAAALLAEFRAGGRPEHRARAELSLAQAASRRGEFDTAQVHAEVGLHLLQLQAAGDAGDVLRPDLLTERAIALAARGRVDDATAVIETLPAVFAGHACSRFRLELHARIARGELAEAAALSASRSPLLPIDVRTELLADLLAATFGEGVGTLESERLRADIAHDEERAFVTAVSPALLAAFEDAAGEVDEPYADRVSVPFASAAARLTPATSSAARLRVDVAVDMAPSADAEVAEADADADAAESSLCDRSTPKRVVVAR